MTEHPHPHLQDGFRDLFRGCTLLGDLNDMEISKFLSLSIREDFAAGQEILEEDKVYQGLWIILAGECEVLKPGAGGGSRLATLGPGNVFGEMSFLQAAPHSASVKAINHVQTLRLMRDKYDQLKECCPEAAYKIAANIVRILSERLRKMDEWTCRLVVGHADHRKHQEWHDFRAKLYSGLFE